MKTIDPNFLTSFDTETHLIQPGLLAPPLVCGSSAHWSGGAQGAQLHTRQAALDKAWALILGPWVIAGANIAFDMGVLMNEEPNIAKHVIAKYDRDEIHDVQIAEALHAIAGGHLFCNPDGTPLKPEPGKKKARYSLAICVRIRLGREDAKTNDVWRLRYALLERVPMERWPFEAVQYPKDDAWNTVECAAHQLGIPDGVEPLRNLENQPAKARTALALHLGAMWGITVDRARYEALLSRVEPQHAAFVERYRALGFIRKDDTEDQAAVKRAVAVAYGATGVCPVCNGKGKVRPLKAVPCRGKIVKRKYEGCQTVFHVGVLSRRCETCNSTGEILKPGNEVICQAKDGGCDGTGLDLSTAPALPRTDTGGISKDRDALAESGDDDLADYGDNEQEKVRDTYLPELAKGLDGPINLRPNVMVASRRVSYDGPWQLLPRACPACSAKVKRPELCMCVRPCITARPGNVLFSVDYEAGELVTLSQVCLWICGASEMADTINRTKSPGSLHTALGAKMMGISYEEMVKRLDAGDSEAKRFRQAAKPFNFGAPGGMGPAKLVATNRKKAAGTTTGPDGRVYAGIRFCILIDGARECGAEKVTRWRDKPIAPTCKACLEAATRARQDWFAQWPEMETYFAWVKEHVDENGELPCLGPWCAEEDGQPHAIRGGLAFCDGANNGFQSLLADAATDALWDVAREAYGVEDSVLHRSVTRTTLFAHDELWGEMREELAHEASHRVAELMVASLRKWCPDVHGAAEPTIMRHWYKDAKPVYRDGRLVPWEPKS